jgi:hypothetical protein
MIAFVVVASACGGSDTGGDTTTAVPDSAPTSDGGLTTVTIDDAVVTLEIPEGAVPAGTEIDIEAGDIPAALAQVSDITVYAFDLEPSGLMFSEPATITFRVAAPGDTGTPLIYVIIESEDGKASFLSSETARRGDEVEVTALVDHFSQAYLVLPDGTEVILTPELLQMRVGESARSEMKFREGQEPSFTSFTSLHAFFYEDDFDYNVLPVASGFITATWAGSKIEVTCLKATNGVIQNAYEAIVEDNTNQDVHVELSVAAFGWGGLADTSAVIRLLGDVECEPAPDTTTTSTTSTNEPPATEKEEVGDQEGATGEQVAEGEGEPAGDIEKVSYVRGDAGEHCFVVDVVGDGETLATEGSGWYDIIVDVDDPDGGEWRANVAYFEPTPTDRGVYLGPSEPGQQKLEGATVTAAWEDSGTLRSCVDGGETSLAVATFKVSIGVSTSNGTFWDYATGIGEA